MSKWEKLNKEFDDALNSMTLEDWDNWYHRVERKRMNQNKMKQSEISDNYQVGDVCQFKKAEEGHPRVFTTHKVDMDYGVVYYYKLDGVEESIGTSYIKKINL
jgi:hypothetical protein